MRWMRGNCRSLTFTAWPRSWCLPELLEEPNARLDRQGDGLRVLERDARLPVERVRVLVAGGLGRRRWRARPLARDEGFEIELGCLRHVVSELRQLSLSTRASIRNSRSEERWRGGASLTGSSGRR